MFTLTSLSRAKLQVAKPRCNRGGGSAVKCRCQKKERVEQVTTSCKPKNNDEATSVSRREVMLKSPLAGGLFLGAVFTFGAAPRPKGLGVTDYGSGVKSLGLCPATPNCISTAEAANDLDHYVPGWNYAPEDGRAMRETVTQEKAMQELKQAVEETDADGFTPKVIEQTADYLYVEYESPTFGFIDDVEFWFPGDKKGTLEYRSASRIGESDGKINRKRIKALREALEKKGWRSLGYY
jgi:uncharacterized protein (DUF1499 family)